MKKNTTQCPRQKPPNKHVLVKDHDVVVLSAMIDRVLADVALFLLGYSCSFITVIRASTHDLSLRIYDAQRINPQNAFINKGGGKRFAPPVFQVFWVYAWS